jgi:hypothetical protein
MEITEILIRGDGTLMERRVHERILDVGQSVMDGLTEETKRNIRNVMHLPDCGMTHANIGVHDTLWSVMIDRISLNTKFRLISDVLVPAFTAGTDIEMPLVWHAPKELRLVFAVQITCCYLAVKVEGNWLFALDKEKRGYRLPLPNLHDDCLLCTGNFDSHFASCYEALMASLEQFRKSQWNSDLMRNLEQSQKFFRFRPTNETFEVLPIDAEDWTTLCDKVSTSILERVVI